MAELTQQPSDQEIMAHHARIKEDLMAKPLIGPLIDFGELEHDYEGNERQVFSGKIKNIKSQFKGMRSTRRDGNCFYRAAAYRFAQLLADESCSSVWSKYPCALFSNPNFHCSLLPCMS